MSRYSSFAYQFRNLHGEAAHDYEVIDAEFEDRSGFPRAVGAAAPPEGHARAVERRMRRLVKIGLGAFLIVAVVAWAIAAALLIGGLSLLIAAVAS